MGRTEVSRMDAEARVYLGCLDGLGWYFVIVWIGTDDVLAISLLVYDPPSAFLICQRMHVLPGWQYWRRHIET